MTFISTFLLKKKKTCTFNSCCNKICQKPEDSRNIFYLDALRLYVFSQSQLIHLLGVGNSIVPYNRVGQGQDLTSVARVCQGLWIPEAHRIRLTQRGDDEEQTAFGHTPLSSLGDAEFKIRLVYFPCMCK